jgi:hypothetical protein
MNEKALRNLWTSLGSALALISVACYVRSTGAKLVDASLKLADLDPHAVPIFSIPVIFVLSWLLQRVGWVYTENVLAANSVAPWPFRLPVAFLDAADLDFTQPLGRSYQRWLFFLFIVLPVLIEIQQFGLFVSGDVLLGDHPVTRLSGIHKFLASGLDGAGWLTDYRYAGQQYYPMLQPWVYLLFSLLLICITVLTVVRIFRPARPPSGHPTPKPTDVDG